MKPRPGWGRLLLCLALIFAPRVGAGLAEREAANEPSPAARGFMGFLFSYSQGALVVLELYPDGPAERAGLLEGDRVVAVNGVAFRFSSELEMRAAFDWVKVAEPVDLTIERGGKTETVTVETSEMPQVIARQSEEKRRISLLSQSNENLKRIVERGEPLLVEKLTGGTVRLTARGSQASMPDVLEVLQLQHKILRQRVAAMKPGDRLRFRISRRQGLGWSLVFIRPGGELEER